jgi:hypothetical protein
VWCHTCYFNYPGQHKARPYHKNSQKAKRAGDVAQVVVHLPHKYEALRSSPGTATKKKRREDKRGEGRRGERRAEIIDQFSSKGFTVSVVSLL